MTITALRTALLAAAASLALYAATVWFGAAALALSLLAPLPVAVTALRHGAAPGILSLTLTAAGSLLLGAGWGVPLVYLVVYGPAGVILPLLLRRRWRWDRVVLAALLVSLLASAGMVGVGVRESGLSVRQVIQQEIDSEIQAVTTQAGDRWSKEQQRQVRQVGETLSGIATRAWPAMLALGNGILLLVTLWALVRLLPADLPWVAEPFREWRAPEHLVWGVIGGGFALLIPVLTGAGGEIGKVVGWNLLLLLVPVYFLQGLAVLLFLLQRYAVSPLIRAMILAMVFLFNPMPLVVASVGLFDIWADFRKPRVKT